MVFKKAASDSGHNKERLKRTLGLPSLIFFGVGVILGAGIYALVGKAAGFAGNMLWFSFLIASLTAVLTAFSYAELVALFPIAGGEYVYTKKAIGNKTANFIGSMISLNGIVSGATIALAFAGYFAELVNINQIISAIGILLIILTINIIGIRESSIANIIFTIIEIGGLCYVIYAAFPYIGSVDLIKLPEQGFNGLMIAAALSFYSYIGFEDIVKLAEETKNPEKKISMALFIAPVIVFLIYGLVSISAVSAIPFEQLAASKSPLADILNKRFGYVGAIIISVVALFSTSNTILSNMIGSSRVILSMSEESKLFKVFSYVSPRFKTPVAAVLLVGILMAVFSLIGNLMTVALIANLFIYITFFSVNLAVIILRKKEPHLHRPFKIPGAIKGIPVICIMAIIMILIMFVYNIGGLFISFNQTALSQLF